jgi:hypothetical protein
VRVAEDAAVMHLIETGADTCTLGQKRRDKTIHFVGL